MNCYFHSDVPAVSVCSVCGVGMCPTCTDMTIRFEEGTNICRRCAPAKLRAANQSVQKDKFAFQWRYYFTLLPCLFFVVMLIATMICPSMSKSQETFQIIIGWFMFSTFVLSLTGAVIILVQPKPASTQLKHTLWMITNPDTGCLMYMFELLVAMVFGFILVPVYCYRMGRQLQQCDEIIKNNNQLLEQLETINAQL